VVWWDPRELEGSPDDARGVRREDLISKDARPADIAADRARYDAWREKRQQAQAAGGALSLRIATATEITNTTDAAGPERIGAREHSSAPMSRRVVVEDASQFIETRPSGKRFGTLVHALLATLPLEATPAEVADLAALHAKLFAATDDERSAASAMAVAVTRHARWQDARQAAAAGRRVWREAPVSMRMDDEPGKPPTLVDGQVDLAYETEAGWIVIDFKTDIEIASAQDAYKRQVALYAEAVAKATGLPAQGVLLRV
jgi:ATP-dependent exoDNAse (exonuclease V) beta subunit